MNKRIKKLIIGLCVLIVICVTYIIVIQNSSNSDDETDTDSDSQNTSSLTAFKSSDITELSFNDISLVKTDDVWVYENDSDYPVDNDIVNSLTDTIADLTYTDCINKSDIDDLSVYGLENISFSITYTADSVSHSIYVGSYNSIIGGYYVTLDNDENIYIVETNLTSAFGYDSIYDILTADTIPEIDASYMTGMALITPETSKTYSYEIISSSDENSEEENTDASDSEAETSDAETSDSDDTDTSDSGSDDADTSSIIWYVQNEDIASGTVSEKAAVDTDTFAAAVDSILNATTESVAAYKPTDEDLTNYGLIIPTYTIIITYLDSENETEQNTLTITLGNTDENDNCYAIINDSSMVIALSGIDLSGLSE